MTHCVLIPDETVKRHAVSNSFRRVTQYGHSNIPRTFAVSCGDHLLRLTSSMSFSIVGSVPVLRYRFTVNDTDTTGTVLPVPVPVSYRFVLTVCNPSCGCNMVLSLVAV